MANLLLILVLTLSIANCQELDKLLAADKDSSANDSNKDMYVIHAMVYQVGILTNSSDYKELENDTNTGAQEALTFYRSNGSNIDLSSIPTPLLTNVTGQNFVGVAPVSTASDGSVGQLTWSAEKPATIDSATNTYFENTPNLRDTRDSGYGVKSTATTEDDSNEYVEPFQGPDGTDDMHYPGFSIERALRKRETKEETDAEKFIKVVDGNAVIPQEAGIRSVALPPLLSLNNNFSEIPVPIPNTSIVHYARVNTLITSANDTS